MPRSSFELIPKRSLTLIVEIFKFGGVGGPRLPNGQGQGCGAGAWAERWDKGEGAMRWGEGA